MKGFKKKIREDTLKRIDKELPEVEGIGEARKTPKIPLLAFAATPVLAVGVVLATVLPLALRQPLEPSSSQSSISQSSEQGTQSTPSQPANGISPVGVEEARAIDETIGISGAGSKEERTLPTLKRVLEGKANLLRTLEGYDEDVERK